MSGWKDMPPARHRADLVSRTDPGEARMGELMADFHAGWRVTYMIVNSAQLKLTEAHCDTMLQGMPL